MKATKFGRYLLLDKVASGGMAEVWRGKIVGESGFQRMIAIKKILPHVCEDPDFISMFTDEANITVQLQHPNIGQVYEFSKLIDIYYIAMEYISGKDLKTIWSHMRQRKTVIPPELSCYVVQKMAEGLSYAHNKKDNFGNSLGIVHRDVSPQNALISWDGEVKVIDFGIAKADDKQSRTRAGTLKGKFAYMSPEQIRGLKLDGRADTFALGVCLYELLTGERGFAAESEFSLLEKVRNVEIKPPTMVNRDIPPELERSPSSSASCSRRSRRTATTATSTPATSPRTSNATCCRAASRPTATCSASSCGRTSPSTTTKSACASRATRTSRSRRTRSPRPRPSSANPTPPRPRASTRSPPRWPTTAPARSTAGPACSTTPRPRRRSPRRAASPRRASPPWAAAAADT
jgi:serine/threonine protein kinase